MIFCCKMRWELDGMSFDDLWMQEAEEARTAIQTIESGMVQHLYKVAAERYVIVIGNLPNAEELDRTAMSRLPMHEHLIFEEVLSLEEGSTIDVPGYLKPRREHIGEDPRLLYYVQLAWEPRERKLEHLWDGAKRTLSNRGSTKVVSLYRVAGQQRMVLIVDVCKAEDLTALVNLPVLESPAVEKVWLLRDYHLFAEDVWKGYKV
jgi:muconolactone delta-isomerase